MLACLPEPSQEHALGGDLPQECQSHVHRLGPDRLGGCQPLAPQREPALQSRWDCSSSRPAPTPVPRRPPRRRPQHGHVGALLAAVGDSPRNCPLDSSRAAAAGASLSDGGGGDNDPSRRYRETEVHDLRMLRRRRLRCDLREGGGGGGGGRTSRRPVDLSASLLGSSVWGRRGCHRDGGHDAVDGCDARRPDAVRRPAPQVLEQEHEASRRRSRKLVETGCSVLLPGGDRMGAARVSGRPHGRPHVTIGVWKPGRLVALALALTSTTWPPWSPSRPRCCPFPSPLSSCLYFLPTHPPIHLLYLLFGVNGRPSVCTPI
jgi:hypothetical protein